MVLVVHPAASSSGRLGACHQKEAGARAEKRNTSFSSFCSLLIKPPRSFLPRKPPPPSLRHILMKVSWILSHPSHVFSLETQLVFATCSLFCLFFCFLEEQLLCAFITASLIGPPASLLMQWKLLSSSRNPEKFLRSGPGVGGGEIPKFRSDPRAAVYSRAPPTPPTPCPTLPFVTSHLADVPLPTR